MAGTYAPRTTVTSGDVRVLPTLYVPPMTLIRPYAESDRTEWRRMRTTLWPGSDADMSEWLSRRDAAVFVAERDDGGLCGFAEAGERPFVDGCDSSPVAYLEGWYVDPDVRAQKIGARLVAAVETWARARGHRELASDTDLDNLASQQAHQCLGFAETERLVLYRKTLE
jgi:aminoglycoside 6'-N-acetyltransferase I